MANPKGAKYCNLVALLDEVQRLREVALGREVASGN